MMCLLEEADKGTMICQFTQKEEGTNVISKSSGPKCVVDEDGASFLIFAL